MNIFEQLKSTLDIIDVAEKYGINVINAKYALCPFHNDTHPSMSFKGDICRCFTCNETFDCISLVSKLFHLTPIKSVKKLNKDFGLNFDTKQPLDHDCIDQITKEKEVKRLFNNWEKKAFITLTEYLHLLNNWKKQYAPTKEEFTNGNINEKYIEACHNIDYIHYLIEIFMNGTSQNKFEHRNEVEKIGNKLRTIRIFETTK